MHMARIIFVQIILRLSSFLVPDTCAAQKTGSEVVNKLTLCMLIERNTIGKVYDYNRFAAAMDMAIEYAENQILPATYRIEKVYREMGDKRPYVVARAMDLLLNGVNCSAFVGPGSGRAAENLNDAMKFYNIPVIGIPASGLGQSGAISLYQQSVRVSIAYRMVAEGLLRFFATHAYTTPTFLEEQTFSFYEQMAELTEITMKAKNFELYSTSYFIPFDGSNVSAVDAIMRPILLQATQHSRVFIIYAAAKVVRQTMLTAHQLGLTKGDHVFIAVELYSSSIWGKFTWEQRDHSDLDAKEAYRCLLLLGLIFDELSEVFWKQVRHISQRDYGYKFSDNERVDPIVMHAYDAIIVYATVVAQIIDEDLILNGSTFLRLVANSTIPSPISGYIRLNSERDRELDFVVKSFNFKSSIHENLYEYPSSGGPMIIHADLDWFGQQNLPPNAPFCGFHGENIKCQPSLSPFEIVLTIIFSIVFMIGFTLTYKSIRDHLAFNKIDKFWWRIYVEDLRLEREESVASMVCLAQVTLYIYLLLKNSLQNSIESLKSDAGDSIVSEPGLLVQTADPITTDSKTAWIDRKLYSLRKPAVVKQDFEVPTKEFKLLRVIHNAHLQQCIGIVVNADHQCVRIVEEYCSRGSLRALITDRNKPLDWAFKNSFMNDIAEGMAFLHSTKLISHGLLNDDCCMIDSRFVLKVAGSGLNSFSDISELREPHADDTERDWRLVSFKAPEFLRGNMPLNGTQKGDVYSYGIMMQQIILQGDPYMINLDEPKKKRRHKVKLIEVLMEVKKGTSPPTRPRVPSRVCSREMHELMSSCWSEQLEERPPFSRIRMRIHKIVGRDADVLRHLVHQLEDSSSNLEKQVERKTREFMAERQRSDDLLKMILPAIVVDALRSGKVIKPENFASTTVYFGDVDGFSEAVEAAQSPVEVVHLLNSLYTIYDDILPKYDVFQVEAVKDAYLITSGLPVRNGIKHVSEIASMAIELREKIVSLKSSPEAEGFKLRVGIHSGPCVAAVVGLKLPRYCLFGDTVNTSSRMESSGKAGSIHCSESSKILLDSFPHFVIAERGVQEIKGKGKMKTYWIIGKKPQE